MYTEEQLQTHQFDTREEEIAIKSTKVLGLSVAGVDLMRSKRGH